jgi:hypothetical protein
MGVFFVLVNSVGLATEGFGPFTFDRQAYEAEVQRMVAELAPPDAKTP